MFRLSVILVSPQGDANIGAVARAMKNFGFDDLRLVNPVPFNTDAARTWAVDAKDILDRAEVHGTLDSALGDISFSLAFTRRIGRSRRRDMEITEAAPLIADRMANGSVAIVFGQEDSGLSNGDIRRCDQIVTIPTSAELPSLNLAQSVLIACHEIFKNLRDTISTEELRDEVKPAAEEIAAWQYATRQEIEPLMDRFVRTLDRLGYEDSVSYPVKSKIINQFNKLFGRAGLTMRDIRMFEGLLSRIDCFVDIKCDPKN